MSKQPKLSLTNGDAITEFRDLLFDPEAPVFVARIGKRFKGKDDQHYTPVLLLQRRTDVGGSTVTEEQAYWLDWGNILRKIVNVADHRFEGLEVEQGMIVDDARLTVKYSTEPAYKGQDTLINPSTDEEVTLDDEPLYRTVVFGFTNEDIGFELMQQAREQARERDIEENTDEVTPPKKAAKPAVRRRTRTKAATE